MILNPLGGSFEMVKAIQGHRFLNLPGFHEKRKKKGVPHERHGFWLFIKVFAFIFYN